MSAKTITLIGTGNLGTNLAAALLKAGHKVVQLHGRSFQLDEIEGDVVIISIKDDALRAVAEKLKDTDKLVVHTAGSVPMNVLPTARRGVFYPMQTFSKQRIVDFSEIPIFLESGTDIELLEELAHSVSQKVFHIDSEKRKSLHLAAVFACNFANHCYDLAAQILQQHDIPFEVMLPLIDETARKVHTLSPHEAQTGPAVRYDKRIIEKQENMLTGDKKEIYHLMSQSIHNSHDKL